MLSNAQKLVNITKIWSAVIESLTCITYYYDIQISPLLKLELS